MLLRINLDAIPFSTKASMSQNNLLEQKQMLKLKTDEKRTSIMQQKGNKKNTINSSEKKSGHLK
jgi:hypothetical protein